MTEIRIPMVELASEAAEVGDEIRRVLGKVVESGRFILGPEVTAFEQEVADYLNVGHAVALNSGTDALALGLQALGVGPGDEVITSPFSFVAAAEAVRRAGAMPVFADIAPETFHLDPIAVRHAITPRTRAILPVHLFGEIVGIEELLDLADRFSLTLFEDAAQAFGATWNGRKAGTIGVAGAFSFFPSKPLGAYGDGGLFVSDDAELAESVRRIARHGARGKYFSEVVGCNSRLDELQAAVVRVKLPRVDEWNQRRRVVAASYTSRLGQLTASIRIPKKGGPEHVFHQYTIRVSSGWRDDVRQALSGAGVASMIYYPYLISDMPAYRGTSEQHFPHALRATKEVLSLPINPWLQPECIDEICRCIESSLTSARE